MTNYLVQRFLCFVSEASSKLRRKPWFSLFPFFLIFRNYSGDFTYLSFRSLVILTNCFQFSDWLPAFKITGQVLINLSNFLGGLAGPYQPTLQENTQLVTMVEVLVQLV